MVSFRPTDFFPKRFEVKFCLFLLTKNNVGLTYHATKVFENGRTTYAQVQTILAGMSVSGLSIDELMQIKHFNEGISFIKTYVEEGKPILTKDFICQLHIYVAKEENSEWGTFRTSQVHIQGLSYNPPQAKELESIFSQGLDDLANMSNPFEQSMILFLWMARNQFFFDGNKRTAFLAANALLIANGHKPIVFLEKDTELFNEKISRFYESNCADEILKYFVSIYKDLYPEDYIELSCSN